MEFIFLFVAFYLHELLSPSNISFIHFESFELKKKWFTSLCIDSYQTVVAMKKNALLLICKASNHSEDTPMVNFIFSSHV